MEQGEQGPRYKGSADSILLILQLYFQKWNTQVVTFSVASKIVQYFCIFVAL